MDDAVRIEAGYHIIDTPAWVRQRTSGPVADLTTALNEFTDHPLFDNLPPAFLRAAFLRAASR